MEFSGKVTYFGAAANGVPVTLLAPDSGVVLWSGYADSRGFFLADIPGVTEVIATVAGEFSAGIFPPAAQHLDASGPEYVALISVPYRLSDGMGRGGPGTLLCSDGVIRDSRLFTEAIGGGSGYRLFPANLMSLSSRGDPDNNHLWATYVNITAPVAMHASTGTVHTEASLSFPSVVMGDKTGYSQVWHAEVLSVSTTAVTYTLTLSNPLQYPPQFIGSMQVTQTPEDAVRGIYALEGSAARYSGTDFRMGDGVWPIGWIGFRHLTTTAPAANATYGVTNNGEVFTYGGVAGWVKVLDLPNPVADGNTLPSPFPAGYSYLYSGATYEGATYVCKSRWAELPAYYCLTDYALSAGMPAALATADEWCQRTSYSLSQHCMYGSRAVRMAFTVSWSSEGAPDVYTSHGVSDYSFVTDALTVHPLPVGILEENGSSRSLGYAAQSYLVGDCLLLYCFIEGDGAHVDVLSYSLLTNTYEWLARRDNLGSALHVTSESAQAVTSDGRVFRLGGNEPVVGSDYTHRQATLLEVAADGALSYALSTGIVATQEVIHLPLVTTF